jgi:hypothetical protein
VLFTAYPTLRERLGLGVAGGDAGLRLRRFRPAARIATADGASLVGDALREPGLLGATVAAGALSVTDKLRLLALRAFATSRTVDDCFAAEHDRYSAREFLRARGFSERAIGRFFAPFYGGILLDPTLGTSASVLLFTFKMLAEGDTAVPAAGMGALARRLAEGLPAGTLRLDTPVAGIDVTEGRVQGVTLASGERIVAEHVVVAAESPAAARLAASAGAGLATPSTPPPDALGCATVYFAAAEPPLPGSAIWLEAGAAAGGSEPPVVTHAVTLTEVAPEYAAASAPYGRHLLAATAVGEAATLDEATLVRRAESDVRAMRAAARLGGMPALAPVAVERVPYAQFGQPPGARTRRTPASLGVPGLWRASETAHSSSLEGAARGGALAAAAILSGAH